MQAPENSAANIATSLSSTTLGKRKSFLAGSSTPAELSKPQHPTSKHPGPKRQKTVHSLGDIEGLPEMNKGKGVLRPGVVDLTKGPSNFQPHSGAKRLVIKNLRTPSSLKDVDKYYDVTWNGLDEALTSIYKREEPSIPREVLSRGAEAICRRGQAQKLSNHIKDRNRTYLLNELMPYMERNAGNSAMEAVGVVYGHWRIWIEQVTLMRAIFSFLDRTYHLKTKDCLPLEDQAITLFRHIILNKGRLGQKTLGQWVVTGTCDLVQRDREGNTDLFDPGLLRDSISMLHISGIYNKTFEPEFLRVSEEYYQNFAGDLSNANFDVYIASCDRLIERESIRCDAYNLDNSTKKDLLDFAHYALIEQCSEKLLDTNSVGKLIDEYSLGSLKALYKLLSLSKIQQNLKIPWEAYIISRGAAIVSDPKKIDDMVVRLLEMKRKLDVIIRDSFGKDDAFTFKLREAFSNFINDSKNTAALGKELGNSKVGEMIAKYMDLLLRNGIKAVPRSLATDLKDRDAAEKLGQSSTGDEDAELDRNLEQGLELFRFIQGKDVFEAFYKKDLAKRLLMGRSASQDAERNMLAKLKNECGYTFTHNLEQMFKDQELAREEMAAYKLYQLQHGKPSLDLQVSVMCSSAWPSYSDVQVKLPGDVAQHIEKYDLHYKHKHSGRKLTWKHSLAHSIVRAQFNKGPKELVVSGFQAIVLVLFNDIGSAGNLSYTDIAAATGLVDAELIRTLQSLACAKLKILNKHPKGREVNPTDTFTVNTGFSDPKYRIKINQIQLKETKEEVEHTHERVYQDRQYETQAAIVRIMKSRKTMTHPQLVAEVINQTKKRGEVEIGEIKKNLEKLIEKEYIEREGSSYVYLA